jgi:FemAB-related protein (PEP-CTERM system-associated)
MSVEVAQLDGPRLRSSIVAVAAEEDSAAWDSFVSGSVEATSYHEWAWRRVFQEAFGHRPIYLIARCGGMIRGILPLVHIKSFLFGRTLTSLPFLNYGGVVAESDAVAQDLLEAAIATAQRYRCRHVELRHVSRRFPQLPYKQHKVTMLLPLTAGMWDRLDRKVRNQIRKAQKSTLAHAEGGAELLGEFYAVFSRNMRDLGTPVYSRRFFEHVLEAFPSRARLHLVRLRSVPVAAGVTYRTGRTLEVPWASSIRDYNTLCPNHLLYWSIIETAVETGCDVLDLGRCTPDEGTFKFKEQWGASRVPLHWEYFLSSGTALPDASPANPQFRAAIEVWKRLPLPFTRLIGPRIVRSIP